MGTPTWPDDPHRTKRQRRFSAHDVPVAQEEARWKCRTCDNVIASNDDVYCIHCKMYWEDVKNGLFKGDIYD